MTPPIMEPSRPDHLRARSCLHVTPCPLAGPEQMTTSHVAPFKDTFLPSVTVPTWPLTCTREAPLRRDSAAVSQDVTFVSDRRTEPVCCFCLIGPKRKRGGLGTLQAPQLLPVGSTPLWIPCNTSPLLQVFPGPRTG